MECGIIAHTLDGDVHILSLTLHLQTDGRAAQIRHIGFLQLTDDADCKRTGLCSLLIGLQNVLNACSGLLILAHAHAELNGLCIVFADIDYASAVLQRTVVVVGSNACYSIVVGIAVTVESLYHYAGSFAALRGVFIAVNDRHYLDGIVAAFFQTESVGTVVAAVAANELLVNLSVVGILAAFDIDGKS